MAATEHTVRRLDAAAVTILRKDVVVDVALLGADNRTMITTQYIIMVESITMLQVGIPDSATQYFIPSAASENSSPLTIRQETWQR